MDFEGVDLDDDVKGKLAEKFQQALDKQLKEHTTGLKSKVDELLSEKKRVQQEREEARQAVKMEAEERAKADNNYKQLFESQQTETSNLQQEIKTMNEKIKKQHISEQAVKIATSLSKDTQRANLLQQQISQRLTMVDNEMRVTDADGNLTVSSIDDLTTSIKASYPFLIDGSQANGGGAARSEGNAKDQTKQIPRAEFDSMDHGKRSQFVKSGGKVIND